MFRNDRARIVLGGAQFGLEYGVSNNSGIVSRSDLSEILRLAESSGISLIDTAPSYGCSELTLGLESNRKFKFISKISSYSAETKVKAAPINWVRSSVKKTLSDLKIDSLHGLLFHDALDLTGEFANELLGSVIDLKSEGLVSNIGVSIYSPRILNSIDRLADLDFVQAPYSILDRRIEREGWMEYFDRHGITFFARSIFLQGLLLMDSGELPRYFDRWRPLWELWHSVIKETNLSPIAACLSFVLRKCSTCGVVIGVQSRNELSQLLSCSIPENFDPNLFEFMEILDTDLIHPYQWQID